MTDAVVAQKSPYVIELEAGKYWWCACGRSKNQPFCDGSHKGSEFSPVMLEVAEKTKMALCGCKRSGHKPTCDGAHSKL
jgi:CDGSH-type Zn-finger protein